MSLVNDNADHERILKSGNQQILSLTQSARIPVRDGFCALRKGSRAD